MPPKALVTVTILLATFLVALNIYTALLEPSLGIAWKANTNHGLEVAKVFPHSPAEQAGIKVGTVFKVIKANNNSESLTETTIIEEPDNLGDYDNAQSFFAAQNYIAQILEQKEIVLISDSGEEIKLSPMQRKIGQLPLMYWFQLFCGMLSLLAGIAVLAFKQYESAAKAYAFNGMSFTLVTFAAAIYSGRELALPGSLFFSLSSFNHLGALLFTASFVAIAWYVPKPLYRFPITRLLVLLYTLFWLADYYRWETASAETWVQLPILAGLLLSFICAGMQWRRCKQRPDEKQTLRWLLLSLLIPGILFLSFTIVLQWLNIELVIPQGYAFGILLVMYLGISLGVVRFALFELDRWWGNIWLWLLTGISFLIIDISLASFLHWNEAISSLLAIILVGFVYVPIRQWFLTRIFKQRNVSLEALTPQIIHLVTYADKPKELAKQWKKLLQQAFSPLAIKADQGNTSAHVKILNQGTVLFVPDIGVGSSLTLEFANQGSRLFTKGDIELTTSIIHMVKKAMHDAQLYQKSIAEERQRISDDLHDDLGAKLLSIVYKSETNEQKELAQQAMGALREVISTSLNEKVYFVDQLKAWEIECKQRVDNHNINFIWKQQHIDPALEISTHISIQLSKILREAISNVLKHGDNGDLCVRIQVRCGHLFVSVRNQGAMLCNDNKAGRGRENMKRRIQSMGGMIRWRGGKRGGCHVIWVIPEEKLL